MTDSTPKLLTGCVKWFNSSLNYGFITVLSEGENKNVDIFCHQSNLKTKIDCYRTLTVGECVQFELTKSDNSKHPYHATNITGFNGGMLHCENPTNRNTNYRDGGDNSGRGRGGHGGRGGGRGGGPSGGPSRYDNDGGSRDGGRGSRYDSDGGSRDGGSRDSNNSYGHPREIGRKTTKPLVLNHNIENSNSNSNSQ